MCVFITAVPITKLFARVVVYHQDIGVDIIHRCPDVSSHIKLVPIFFLWYQRQIQICWVQGWFPICSYTSLYVKELMCPTTKSRR